MRRLPQMSQMFRSLPVPNESEVTMSNYDNWLAHNPADDRLDALEKHIEKCEKCQAIEGEAGCEEEQWACLDAEIEARYSEHIDRKIDEYRDRRLED